MYTVRPPLVGEVAQTADVHTQRHACHIYFCAYKRLTATIQQPNTAFQLTASRARSLAF